MLNTHIADSNSHCLPEKNAKYWDIHNVQLTHYSAYNFAQNHTNISETIHQCIHDTNRKRNRN